MVKKYIIYREKLVRPEYFLRIIEIPNMQSFKHQRKIGAATGSPASLGPGVFLQSNHVACDSPDISGWGTVVNTPTTTHENLTAKHKIANCHATKEQQLIEKAKKEGQKADKFHDMAVDSMNPLEQQHHAKSGLHKKMAYQHFDKAFDHHEKAHATHDVAESSHTATASVPSKSSSVTSSSTKEFLDSTKHAVKTLASKSKDVHLFAKHYKQLGFAHKKLSIKEAHTTEKETAAHETARALVKAHQDALKSQHDVIVAAKSGAPKHVVEKTKDQLQKHVEKVIDTKKKHTAALKEKATAEEKLEKSKHDVIVKTTGMSKAAEKMKDSTDEHTTKTVNTIKDASSSLVPSLGHCTEVKHCDFMKDTVFLDKLKPLPHVSKEYQCMGFASVKNENGETEKYAVACKPMKGKCPTSYDEKNCHIVPYNASKLSSSDLKTIFSHI